MVPEQSATLALMDSNGIEVAGESGQRFSRSSHVTFDWGISIGLLVIQRPRSRKNGR
jgi:hypothetical protein